jgi:hypothetical protein
MHQSSTKVAKDALDNFLNASKYLRLQKFDVILNIKRAVLMQI